MIDGYLKIFEDYIGMLFMLGIIIGIIGVAAGIIGWLYLDEYERPKMICIIGVSVFISIILTGISLQLTSTIDNLWPF